jgi:outer membrane murein-binding lipoprotein Lpp
MFRAKFISIAALVASVAFATGCGSTDPAQGLNDVADLSARIEQVRQSSELARQRVDAAVKALQAIARFDFKEDATAIYSEFVAAVDASVKQSAELHACIDRMKGESVPFFKVWEKNLDRFASEQMRQHSVERQAAARERFDAICTAAETAQVGCDAFNKALSDHVAYLRYDLNAAALTVIQGEIAALAQCAATLTTQFTTCQDAAKNYVEAAALPKPTATTANEFPKDAAQVAPTDAAKEGAKDAAREPVQRSSSGGR